MAAKKKLSARSLKRLARIKDGKCGACGKRPPVEGLVECRPCRTYYNGLARTWLKKKLKIKATKRKTSKARRPPLKKAAAPAREKTPAAPPQKAAA
jgi:hypothetical protein